MPYVKQNIIRALEMFWRFRNILFWVIICIILTSFFIFFGVPILIFDCSYKTKYRLATGFSYIFIYLLWAICGISFDIKNRKKIPKDGPYLIIANHQSYWENFFLQLITHEHSWIIKKEILDIPVFGWCLKIVNPVAVDRSLNRSVLQILSEGKKKIQSGLSLVIFPESTRVKPGRDVKFKVSAAKLAKDTNTPILLIAHNAGLIWPNGFMFRAPGKIKVSIIEYIDIAQLEDHDHRTLTSYIEERVTKEKNDLLKIGV